MGGNQMRISRILGVGVLGLSLAAAATSAKAEEITLWSHWADHETKVNFVEEAAKRFEKNNPGHTVKISWYQKNPLYAALKASLQAGTGPDIFYCEPNQTEYIDNDLILALDDQLNWGDIEQWARDSWTFGGKAYALPLEAFTVELYYDKDRMKELGVDLGESKQLDQATFLDVVKKAADKGVTPIVQGVGDRPFPGAYLLHELILKKIGRDDYQKLWSGDVKFSDPRVVEVLNYVRQLVDAGAYPKSFSTLKLGESHYYFHTKPGGLMFPMGSWYTSRAFNPAEKGGQPENFSLGIMQMPVPDGAECPECKTSAIGGSFCINSGTKNPELAVAVLNEMATVDMGTRWLADILVQTGVKSDASKIEGKYKPYFEELQAINADAKFFAGIPQHHIKGQCAETFAQVLNAAFPAGQIGVDQAVQMMDEACKK
jgi:multiple sugar transport system substrate-binding protein